MTPESMNVTERWVSGSTLTLLTGPWVDMCALLGHCALLNPEEHEMIEDQFVDLRQALGKVCVREEIYKN